jgi:WD40 repeat protein
MEGATMRTLGTGMAALLVFLGCPSLHGQQLPPSQKIQIRTTPGAEVYVDGKRRGQADASGRFTIERLSADRTYDIRITMPGKRPFERKLLVVESGKEANLRAVLTDVTGTLEVLTFPSADITVDGKPAGKADAEGTFSVQLSTGSDHDVGASLGGKAPEYTKVRVAEGAVSTVNLPLGTDVSRMPVPSSRVLGQLVFRRAFASVDVNRLSGVSFSPDSMTVGAYDGSGWVAWDVNSGRQAARADLKRDEGEFIGISPDWKYLVLMTRTRPCTAYFGAVKPPPSPEHRFPPCRYDVVLREFSTRTVVARFENVLDIERGEYFDFGPDAHRVLLAAPDNKVSVHDTASARQLWSVQEPGLLRQVLYSPKGDIIACASGEEKKGSMILRSAATGKEVQRIDREEWADRHLAFFRPDGAWIAVWQDAEFHKNQRQRIRLFETSTLKEAEPVVFGQDETLGEVNFSGRLRRMFAFHPSGRYAAALVYRQKGGPGDPGRYSVRIWDLVESRDVWSDFIPDVDSLAFSPDGRWFAVIGRREWKDRTLRLWEIVP